MSTTAPESTTGLLTGTARARAAIDLEAARSASIGAALTVLAVVLVGVSCTPNAHITIERPEFKSVRVAGLATAGPCATSSEGQCTFSATFKTVLADDRERVIQECDQLDGPTGRYTVRAAGSPACPSSPDAAESFLREGVQLMANLTPMDGGADIPVAAMGASDIVFKGRQGPFAVALIIDNSVDAAAGDRTSERITAASTFARQFLCKKTADQDVDASCLFTEKDELSLYVLSSGGGFDAPRIALGKPGSRDPDAFDSALQNLASEAQGDALVYQGIKSAATALRQRVVKNTELSPAIVLFSAKDPNDMAGLSDALNAIAAQSNVADIPVHTVGLAYSDGLDQLGQAGGGTFVLAKADVTASTNPDDLAEGVEFGLTRRILPFLLGHWEITVPIAVDQSASGATFTMSGANLQVTLGGASVPETGPFIAQVTVP
jgi:hypothetical protein